MKTRRSTLSLLIALSCTLTLSCQRAEDKAPQPDLAFKALSLKEQVLLKKIMTSYDRLFDALTRSLKTADLNHKLAEFYPHIHMIWVKAQVALIASPQRLVTLCRGFILVEIFNLM